MDNVPPPSDGTPVPRRPPRWQRPTSDISSPLDDLHALGVNRFSIHPSAQIQNAGHVPFRVRDNNREITVPLDWARERGMSVMLIPHIAYWGSKFLWRGEINFKSNEEWDRFFTDY